MYLFALISETRLVSQSELYRLASALEKNAYDCARAWRHEAPAIVVVDERSRLPKGCQPIAFVEGGDPATLGEHYWDPLQAGPAARVFVENASGLNQGSSSVCETASHEVLEALIDPKLNLWLDHPFRAGVQMALEVCDMVQDTYSVRSQGTNWSVANFVTPHYFDRHLAEHPEHLKLLREHGTTLDHADRLRAPGEIGREGYAILRESHPYGGWRVWAEDRRGNVAQLPDRKLHAAARTRRRGVGLV